MEKAYVTINWGNPKSLKLKHWLGLFEKIKFENWVQFVEPLKKITRNFKFLQYSDTSKQQNIKVNMSRTGSMARITSQCSVKV
jgi:hypothetical protein